MLAAVNDSAVGRADLRLETELFADYIKIDDNDNRKKDMEDESMSDGDDYHLDTTEDTTEDHNSHDTDTHNQGNNNTEYIVSKLYTNLVYF